MNVVEIHSRSWFNNVAAENMQRPIRKATWLANSFTVSRSFQHQHMLNISQRFSSGDIKDLPWVPLLTHCLCICVNVKAINRIPMMQQREIIIFLLRPRSHSSLPSPPFLLSRAIRGEINLSDGLCDLPPGLGGRRSPVNINILPGFTAAVNHPRPRWVTERDRQKEITSAVSIRGWVVGNYGNNNKSDEGNSLKMLMG